MDWFVPIDLYCERVGTGLWAEPLNAWSNLAFPLAALWAWVTARARGQLRPVVVVLIVLGGLIGVGSFLFHVFANAWSELADVVPIWSFVALYTLASIALVGGVAPGRLARIVAIVAAVAVIVFLATTGDDGGGGGGGEGGQAGPDLLNGSGQYAPALLALLVLSGVTLWRGHPIRLWVLAATVTFFVSLCLRTIDLWVCELFPVGAHFLWHVLNGLLVGLLLQGMIRTAPPQGHGSLEK